MEKRFVITGLKFIRTNQEAVRVLLNLVRYVSTGEFVERCFRNLDAGVFVLTGEGDNSLVTALPLFQVLTNGMEV